MHIEFEIIEKFFSKKKIKAYKGIGDDAALFKKDDNNLWAISTDTLNEKVHFEATTDAYKIVQIGTERIKVTGTASAAGVLTIAERGVEGTTAQTHASGAEVVSDVFNLALTGQRENIDAKGYRWEHSGWMDEIALWDKTLSSSEVSDLYNGGNGPINLKGHTSTKDNLIGWWRCGDNDDDTGTTITDQSDEGRDGTLVNTVSIVSGSGNFPPIT